MAPSSPPHLGAALSRLPAPTVARLQAVAALAEGRAWLVGGVVRDLLLNRPPGDLDIVIEGDAVALARQLCATVEKTTCFGTATVRWPDGETWDLVSARRERYPAPAALPEPEPATLREDLLRRDFSVNALAAALAPARWGAVVDVAGGLADLRAARLRILHPDSFRDDPTRLYRAARYAARLGFRCTPDTAACGREAVAAGLVDRLTHDRLRHELERCLDEPEPVAQAALLARWGLLRPVASGLAFRRSRAASTAALLDAWHDIPAVAALPRWLPHLAALLPSRDASAVAERLVLRLRPDADTIDALLALAIVLSGGPWRPGRPSRAARLLDRTPVAAQVALAARWPSLREEIGRYLREWRTLRPHLDGDAVIAAGVPRGPAVGRVLAWLRDARLDGRVASPGDERALVRQWLGVERADAGPSRR